MGKDATRWVVYGRSSSANTKSITDQLSELEVAAEAEGGTVAERLSDPTSASRYATRVRKNWARLLELVPAADVIGLWEPSRGDRKLSTWVAFLDLCREHGTRIHAVSHRRTYDPRVARDYRSLAEDGVDSAYETDKLSDRVLRGKQAAYLAGRPAGKLDFGYLRIYDMATVPPRYDRQVPHPDQAPVVVRIMEELAGGRTLYQVANGLNEDRVPTARGARWWRPGVVRKIAKSQLYRPHPTNLERGCLVRNGQVYVGTWPPLVAESLWQEVQRVLGTHDPAVRKRRRDSAPGRVKYLLSSSTDLLTAPCGAQMNALARDRMASQAGRAAHYHCSLNGCASLLLAEADEYIAQLVCGRLAKPDARDLWVADDPAAKEAKDELARLRGELEEARRSFARPGGISAEALAMKEREMAGPIADAERRSRPAGVPLALLQLIEAAEFGAERVRPAWDQLPILAQREVVVALFSELRVLPATTRITRWTSPEERLAQVGRRIEVEWRQAG